MLRDNSSYFKNVYEQQENDNNSLDDTIKLPDVDPDLFDLAIQCLVAKDIALQPNLARTSIEEITIILNLAFLIIKLGFPDLGEATVCQLKKILINERKALRVQHIRRAYTLPAGHPIRYLFCQAVVREYMMETRASNGFGKMDNDDSDDELTPAQASAYRPGFRYKQLLETIRDFRHDVLEAQDKVLKEGYTDKVIKQATKRSPQQTERHYQDPLDPDRELWFIL
jgi:hypothetical protein